MTSDGDVFLYDLDNNPTEDNAYNLYLNRSYKLVLNDLMTELYQENQKAADPIASVNWGVGSGLPVEYCDPANNNNMWTDFCTEWGCE